MKFESIDRYMTTSPKYIWIERLFNNPIEFFLNSTLSSNENVRFKIFLRDVGILDKKPMRNNVVFTDEGKYILKMRLENSSLWSVMLVNASTTPFFFFFFKNIKPKRAYCASILNMALFDQYPQTPKGRLVGMYKKFCSLPFGTKLGLGTVTEEGKETIFRRGTWTDPDPLVILYALYKFAVVCGDYYEFTLTRLLDHEIDSDGVSPTEIFCLDRETMVPILKGLGINYPDYISVTFTHDLDAISLNHNKAPIDVLRLIAEQANR